jgi:hypothetical protein
MMSLGLVVKPDLETGGRKFAELTQLNPYQQIAEINQLAGQFNLDGDVKTFVTNVNKLFGKEIDQEVWHQTWLAMLPGDEEIKQALGELEQFAEKNKVVLISNTNPWHMGHILNVWKQTCREITKAEDHFILQLPNQAEIAIYPTYLSYKPKLELVKGFFEEDGIYLMGDRSNETLQEPKQASSKEDEESQKIVESKNGRIIIVSPGLGLYDRFARQYQNGLQMK